MENVSKYLHGAFVVETNAQYPLQNVVLSKGMV